MRHAYELLIHSINIASMQNNGQAYGGLNGAWVAIQNGKIAAMGNESPPLASALKVIDGKQKWLTPGLIDSHTHLVFGGNRATEFEMRQKGISYADIARQGGGIQSTVNATQQATESELLESAIARAKQLVEEGVTTIEVKSGYGLNSETECTMLNVAKQLESHLPVNIVTTFLGAHTVPKEYSDAVDDYVTLVCDEMIPRIANEGLASCVDVFCESIGFSPAQCERVFHAAALHGLSIKAHVEQLSDLKGAVLAAKHGALSVDHIEFLAAEDVAAVAAAGSVALLLPGAFYYLRETQLPPIQALRDQNVPIALATDLNPGSSPIASLLTIMNMGCILFNLTPEEALRGVTINAAKALGLKNKGVIETGADADLCLWDIQHPSELSYGINLHRPTNVWLAGKEVKNEH